MAKVIIDHLDGPIGKDIYDWAAQFDSLGLLEDKVKEMEKDIDSIVERVAKELKIADK